MVVDPDGRIAGTVGGAAVEKIAIEKALRALSSGKTERVELDLNDIEHLQTGMVCGGTIELLVEPFGVGPRLLLFGAGHVAAPTARLAREVGFPIVIHDARPEWANEDRFPGASIKVGNTETLADQAETTPDDFLAVMTYCHDEDYKVLVKLIQKPFYYLGVIGSPGKAKEIRKNLAGDGYSKEEMERVTCPIGIDIGSHTPAEIAVSVAAQLISWRRKWEKDKAAT